MEKMEKKERKLNLKILIPAVIAVIVIAIIIIICIVANSSKELKLSEFEKIGIYGYLENDFLNVNELKLKANNQEFNEIEILQIQTKEVLDKYFNTNNIEKATEEEIMAELSRNDIDTAMVDFNGLQIPGYEYNPETKEISRANIYEQNLDIAMYQEFEDNNQKFKITKIEKESDNVYIVYGNFVDETELNNQQEQEENNTQEESKVTVKLSIKDNNYTIDECTIKD